MTYGNVNFGSEKYQTGQIKIRYSNGGTASGRIEIRLGDQTGQVIGNFYPQSTNSYLSFVDAYVPISDSIQGIQTVTFKVISAGAGLCNIEWWQLAPAHQFPSEPPQL